MRRLSLLLCASLAALALAFAASGLGQLPPPPGDGAIGNFVWHDVNGDGIQNDGPDSGIPGVVVVLKVLWPGGQNVAMELKTETDDSGHYLFSDLPVEALDQGSFVHEVHVSTHPSDGNFHTHGPLTGLLPTLVEQGGSMHFDSNPALSLTELTSSQPTDMSIDFGFVGNLAACSLELTARCQGHAVSGGDDCDGKLTGLVLEYLGGGCAADANGQEGKSDCSGGVGFAASVDIHVMDKNGDSLADRLDVGIGDSIAVVAAEKFDSATFVDIVSDDATEHLEIHTSCSAPLAAGDRFGSLRIVELSSTEGGLVSMGNGGADCLTSVGGEVEFSYELHNAGSEAITGIVVTDAFGSLEPAVDLAAGQSMTLDVVENVWDELHVSVVAAAGPQCRADDRLHVKVGEANGKKKKAKKAKKAKKVKAKKSKSKKLKSKKSKSKKLKSKKSKSKKLKTKKK